MPTYNENALNFGQRKLSYSGRDRKCIMDVDEVAVLSEDELLIAIGTELLGQQMLPSSQRELIERAKAWFQINKTLIHDAVCPHARAILKENNYRDAILAIADLLSSVITQVAPFNVAALILKAGVEKLCE